MSRGKYRALYSSLQALSSEEKPSIEQKSEEKEEQTDAKIEQAEVKDTQTEKVEQTDEKNEQAELKKEGKMTTGKHANKYHVSKTEGNAPQQMSIDAKSFIGKDLKVDFKPIFVEMDDDVSQKTEEYDPLQRFSSQYSDEYLDMAFLFAGEDIQLAESFLELRPFQQLSLLFDGLPGLHTYLKRSQKESLHHLFREIFLIVPANIEVPIFILYEQLGEVTDENQYEAIMEKQRAYLSNALSNKLNDLNEVDDENTVVYRQRQPNIDELLYYQSAQDSFSQDFIDEVMNKHKLMCGPQCPKSVGLYVKKGNLRDMVFNILVMFKAIQAKALSVILTLYEPLPVYKDSYTPRIKKEYLRFDKKVFLAEVSLLEGHKDTFDLALNKCAGSRRAIREQIQLLFNVDATEFVPKKK